MLPSFHQTAGVAHLAKRPAQPSRACRLNATATKEMPLCSYASSDSLM